MRNVTVMTAGICAGLLFAARASRADGATPPAGQTAAAPADADFLARALGVNQTEIVLGQMAVKRGTTPEVRATGEKMVQRHSDLGRQLRALANLDAAAPVTLSPAQQRTVARLAATPASDFDRAFKTTVDEGHVEELAMHRQAASHAVDPRVRALAAGRVTALEQSLATARAAAASTAPRRRDW